MSNSRVIYTEHAISTIRKMQRAGASNAEIAMALGTTPARLTSRLNQLGLSRRRTPDVRSVHVMVPEVIIGAFSSRAEARAMTARDLIRLVLLTIAQDDLFSAILDDSK